MAYEWGRFIWWLYHDTNAPGVIQALAALATLILTGVLIWLNVRYLQLTNRLAETAQKQLEVSLFPVLDIRFDKAESATNRTVDIHNTGNNAIKIITCVVGGKFYTGNRGDVMIESQRIAQLENIIVGPGQHATFTFHIVADLPPAEISGALYLSPIHFSMRLNCTDPRGIVSHSFYRRTDGNLQYWPKLVTKFPDEE